MCKRFIGLFGSLLMLCAAAGAADTNASTTPPASLIPKARPAKPGPNDPVEKEYKKIMEEDDAAQAQVDKWLQDNEKFAVNGAGVPDAEMKRRIQERFKPVRMAYEDFIKRHPDHAGAHLAYGSFLNDMHDEEGAEQEWDKALRLDPQNPATFNNLANLYGHVGPVKKAFEYYAKAIELNPNEALYYNNFGTTVYLFRKDAREYYGITEQQVFDKALELYSQAVKLDPTNFALLSDVAQTYYGIRPMRFEDALKAWTNTLAIAHDEIEREGVYIHFARLKTLDGRIDEARAYLGAVTNELYADLKKRLTRNLNEREKLGRETNASPVAPAAEVQDSKTPKKSTE